VSSRENGSKCVKRKKSATLPIFVHEQSHPEQMAFIAQRYGAYRHELESSWIQFQVSGIQTEIDPTFVYIGPGGRGGGWDKYRGLHGWCCGDRGWVTLSLLTRQGQVRAQQRWQYSRLKPTHTHTHTFLINYSREEEASIFSINRRNLLLMIYAVGS